MLNFLASQLPAVLTSRSAESWGNKCGGRELDGNAGDHRLLDGTMGIGGQATAEDDVIAGAQFLHCLDDLRRFHPLGLLRLIGVADGS